MGKKITPDDISVFEAIKSFQFFSVGDVVTWNGEEEEYTVVGLPKFKHSIYYSSGEHSEYELDRRWHGCKFHNQEVLGYLLENSKGKTFRLHILADLRHK